MQLNKTKLNTIPPLNPSSYPLTPLNISFLCAFAPLRDKIRANLCQSVAKIMKNEANLNSSNSTTNPCYTVSYDDLQPKNKKGTKPNEANLKPIPNTLNPHFFQGKPSFSLPLICKNKPNFPTQRITATTCKRDTYNDLHPQTNQKSKPNPNPIQTQFQALISQRYGLLPDLKG